MCDSFLLFFPFLKEAQKNRKIKYFLRYLSLKDKGIEYWGVLPSKY